MITSSKISNPACFCFYLDSLWHVVNTLCPNESDVEESNGILPVIFYLGREECGVDNLKKISLRSLGLTSGGAILRYI